MSLFRALGRRLLMLFRRKQFDADLEEEMRLHRELREQEEIERGLSPKEAHYAVRRRFGNDLVLREEGRDMWGWSWFENLLQDVRYGLRMLAKNPGFTAVAILTLALGIGANTAIFTVINAVLLKPLPFPHPDRLVQIWETDPRLGFDRDTVSPYNFRDWQSQSHDFAAMAAYEHEHFSLTGRELPVGLGGLRVSADFFRVLGTSPLLGRDFLANEDQPGAGHVVVVSSATWQNYFGRDPGIVGRKITLDGESYTVIGVMPSDFELPGSGAEIWTTLAFDLKGQSRDDHFLFAVGRLKPGVTLAAARSEANTIAQRLAQQYPDSNGHIGILLVPLQEEIVGNTRSALLVLWGAVGLVLLIACANMANLLLSRGVARRRELAVRSALGAGRTRLMTQLLAESILLAIIGGALGLIFAYWGIGTIVRTAAIPRAQEVTVNLRILGFTGLLSILTGIIFGLAPAFASSSTDLNSTLKETGWTIEASSSGSRMRSGLVVGEIALSLVLLVSAGLLIKSLWLLGRTDPGFNPKSVLGMRLSLPESKYPNSLERSAVFKRVIERIAILPGVEGVAGVNDLPFSGSRTGSTFDIEGMPPRSPEESRHADRREISPDYFKTMGIPLLKGRQFIDRDNVDAPRVAIINEDLAQKYWPSGDPLGQRLKLYDKDWEIVGVVGNVKLLDLAAESNPEMYLPYTQSGSPTWMFFAVRSRVELGSLIASVRKAAREVVPDEPLYSVRTMEERVAASTAPRRLHALLLGSFAALALVLSAVGTYGVIAYSVAQRTHEIGIRMALGAQRHDVMRQVVEEGVLLIGAGVVFGIFGTLALTRFLTSLLYGVKPTDPATFAAVSAILTGVALLASYIPARRATKVDPMVALRCE
jgi:putative ABC transport system permease protein